MTALAHVFYVVIMFCKLAETYFLFLLPVYYTIRIRGASEPELGTSRSRACTSLCLFATFQTSKQTFFYTPPQPTPSHNSSLQPP